MPDSTVLVAALIAGGLGAAVILMVVGLRGTVVDLTAPPGRIERWLAAQRSPLAMARLAGGALLALLVFAVTRWPVAAAGFGGLVAFWPALTGGSHDEQIEIARLDALVTWTEALRDTVSAHAGLEQAIPATAPNAAPVIRPALMRLVGLLRTRVPLEDALLDLAEQLDHGADLIIAALINNVRRRGDGLTQVLTGLATAGREELDLHRKITASRAGDRRAVQLMIVIVIAVATFLVLFSDSYTAPYRTVTGQVVLAVVLGLFAGAFAWIRSLAAGTAPSSFLPVAGQRLDPGELRIVADLTATTDDTPASADRGRGRAVAR